MLDHSDDCDEDVWLDAQEGLLISDEEITELECPACLDEWKMWVKIIADSGDARYGFWALSLLELLDEIEMFGGKLSDLTAKEWEGLRAVRATINRRRAYREYVRNHPEGEGS
jgi:hypothetical protein